jgi:hypothetical protein
LGKPSTVLEVLNLILKKVFLLIEYLILPVGTPKKDFQVEEDDLKVWMDKLASEGVGKVWIKH